jgi:general secretion pathway protein G
MADKIKDKKKSVTSDPVLFGLLSSRRQKLCVACRGFTLVELIVVTAVIGVLVAMAIPFFNQYINTVKTGVCVADLRTVDKAISAYIIDKNAMPVFLSDVGMGSQLDPWKRSFVYHDLSVAGPAPLEDIAFRPLNTDYDLYSTGENGASTPAAGNLANADDIVRSNNGVYAGPRP